MRPLREVLARQLRSALHRLGGGGERQKPQEELVEVEGVDDEQTARAPFEAALHWVDYEMEQFRPMAGLMSQAEMLANPVLRCAYEPQSTGHEIVRQMLLDIRRFHQTPTDFQCELINFAIQLAGPRIYGLEWKTNQLAIKQRNGWTETFYGIGAVMTGRKEGKSTGLAMLAALVLFDLPAVRIALFSKTVQQACIILNMARDLAHKHQRHNDYKIDGNKESITITHIATGDVRVCTAYSGCADVS